MLTTLMRAFALFAALAFPLSTLAQAPAIPAPTCTKPAVPVPGTKLDKKGSDALNAGATAYQTCVQAYLTERRSAAKQHEAIAKANTDASNALAAEFNGFATALEAFSVPHNAKAK